MKIYIAEPYQLASGLLPYNRRLQYFFMKYPTNKDLCSIDKSYAKLYKNKEENKISYWYISKGILVNNQK